MLQEEDSTEIGWFLWSARNMDAGALADEIGEILGFQVGLKWKTIPTGTKEQLEEEQKSRALIIEVA